MRRKSSYIPSNATLEDYIEVDNEICTAGFPTDADIIEHYCSEPENQISNVMGGDDDSSDEELIQKPSTNDVADSLKILNSFLQTNENTTDGHYKALNKLESLFIEINKKKINVQPQITQYFTAQ